MTANGSGPECPHCGAHLRAFELPDGTGWGECTQQVCFNDECPYFSDGWAWMAENYRAKASYRYRVINESTGATSPLPVWSADAMREWIVDDPAASPSTHPDPDVDRKDQS
jgi:hypothetical protein